MVKNIALGIVRRRINYDITRNIIENLNYKPKGFLLRQKEIRKERRCLQVNYVTFETDWKVD